MNLACSRGMPVTRRGLTKTLGPVMGAMGKWHKEKALTELPGCLRSPCPDVCLSLAASLAAPQGVSGSRLLERVLGLGHDCDVWPKA